MISIDTLAPRMLGCYGFDEPTSPTIDALARDGVLFENAYAPSPWTLPSHASLLTGLYPKNHGVKSHRVAMPPEIVTWAEYMKARGFTTAAIVNAHNVGARYGLDHGFEHFEHVIKDIARAAPSLVEERALAWLDGVPQQPFFLFLHYYDVHSDYTSLPEYEELFTSPYAGHIDGSTAQLLSFWEGELTIGERDREHLVDLYIAGIRQMDDGIGRIVQRLDQLGILDETLIIVCSDHGEEFLEHGSVLHGRTQYEEVLRVPLVIVGPGIPSGKRISEPVSLIDVMPSVVSLLGLDLNHRCDGVDLSSLWSSRPRHELQVRHIFGEADHNNAYEDMTRSVRRGEFKLIYDRITGDHQLYELSSDPNESLDVRREHPLVTRRLLERIRIFSREESSGVDLPEMDPKERESLEALGYLVTNAERAQSSSGGGVSDPTP
jgi:arylsulfatase